MHILLAAPASLCTVWKPHLPQPGTADTVHTAEDLLEFLRTNPPPDAILLSALLTNAPLLALVQAVRKKSSALVLVNGFSGTAEDASALFDAGADDVLAMLNPQTLRARLQAMFRRHRANEPTSRLQLGNVSLHMHPPQMEINGTTRVLRLKQHAVLQNLMLAKGRLLKPEAIRYAIGSPEGDSRLVSTYISTLRGELEKGGANITIECQHKVGYRLTAPSAH